MSEVTLWQGLGSAAGSSSKFYVYGRVWYKTEEISNNKAKIYKTFAIYGPSSKLANYGVCSWASGYIQIGGTSSKATYNGTTYYVSGKKTDSGTYYSSGASISVSAQTASYTTSGSGTTYTSTLSARTVKAPTLVTTYTVTYNANGGSGSPASQSKVKGTALTLSSVKPTRSGYVFNNWKGSDGKTYTPGASYTTDAALTLTAQWLQTYTVSYNANGGTGAPASQTKTYGVALTLSSTVPTKSKMVFVSWLGSDGENYQPGGTYATNAALTLTAQWKNAKTVSVKVGSSYHDGNVYIKADGSYKAGKPFIKINGSYKEGI